MSCIRAENWWCGLIGVVESDGASYLLAGARLCIAIDMLLISY